MITIFNSCDSRLSRGELPKIDLLMWACSLIYYKKWGYKTKLYCTKRDIPYLKQECLYDLYDEIDTDTFENLNKNVNEEHFWSYRKMEALKHEFNISDSSVYSDIDVLMFTRFELNDTLFWCKEQDGIYGNWNNLSKPKDYILPNYIEKTNGAYNCGIVYIKDKNIINEWYNEYMKFAVGNPCKLKIKDYYNNIFACNSEQRIIKAIVEKYKIEPKFVATAKDLGFNENGLHFYVYKRYWEHKSLDTNPALMSLREFKSLCETIIGKSEYKELHRRSKKWQLQI